MSRFWGIGIDTTFDCGHCGAKYAVRSASLTAQANDSVYCDVCRRKMDEWNSTRRPSYTLIERPGPND